MSTKAASDLIGAYFEAWNEHDSKGLAALFEPEGTYSDPLLRLPVKPYDLDAVMASIVAFIPDFGFEIVSSSGSPPEVAVQWCLTGTNTAPIKPGIDPTHKRLHLRGVDILDIGERGIRSVTRYFDQKTMFEQLGMQVIIEPRVQGSATYGYSKRVNSQNEAVPAILGTTWIEFKDQSELDHIRLHSAKIIQDFLEEPGFIGIVTGAAGHRAFTVTAWETEDALYHALDKAHSRAKQEFRTSDLSPAVWTAVWKPHHINRLWVRCPSCDQPNDMTDKPQQCVACGGDLPLRPAYW